MKKHLLKVTKREITGKKVKKLRKEGILPANIYGKDVKSTAVQVAEKEFEKVYKEAGETSVVELDFDGGKRPVLIHNVQLDFLTQQPIHVDFYQVNLKEKIKAMVPVVLTGEAKAIADKVGMLLQTLGEIEVEALPTDLPERIEADVTSLAALNDQLTVADLKKPAGVEILTDGGQVVAKISELVSKEAEEQAQQEAATTAETPEGAAAAPEGEAKAQTPAAAKPAKEAGK